MMISRKSNSSARFWKWRTRSGKTTSECEARDVYNSSREGSLSGHPTKIEIAAPTPMSPFLSESAHVLSLQHPGTLPTTTRMSEVLVPPSPTEDEAAQSSTEATEGSRRTSTSSGRSLASGLRHGRFYSRARHGIENIENKLRPMIRKETIPVFDPIPEHEEPEIHSANGQRTLASSSFLHRTPAWLRSERGKRNMARKLLGRASWHRTNSGDSLTSLSSSIKDLLRVKSPPSSWGSDRTANHSPKSVDSHYPGGEAVRITTPPCNEYTPDSNPPGFFTAGASQATDEKKSPPRRKPIPRSPRYEPSRRRPSGNRKGGREKTPEKSTRKDPFHGTRAFQFDVSEHVPSSPLCPANTNYRGGGMGLCVYHGRRKGESLLRSESTPSSSRASKSKSKSSSGSKIRSKSASTKEE